MKISCIAVDDEPLALEQMGDFIGRIPYLELKASFKKGFDALLYIKKNKTDLVFLDVQMEDISGIQLLKTLNDKPFIILTTAYDQYALEGYELEVNDYLLKPISFERFVRAVERIREMMKPANPPEEAAPMPASTQEYIFVKSDYRMQKVVLQDILFIEGYGDYLKIHLITKRNVVSLLSFKKMESVLPPGKFVRIHKSFVVAINKIDSIGKNAIQLAGQNIPIGEAYKEHFFQLLEEKGLLK